MQSTFAIYNYVFVQQKQKENSFLKSVQRQAISLMSCLVLKSKDKLMLNLNKNFSNASPQNKKASVSKVVVHIIEIINNRIMHLVAYLLSL